MAATKDNSVIREWNQLAAASQSQSNDADVSTSFRAGVTVTVCPIEAVANALGVLVTIEARIGTNDEDWRTLYELRMGAGTANTTNIDVEAASTATVVPVDLTGSFETLGDKYLIHNTISDAASEVVRNAGFVSDVSITIVDGLQNTQETSANLYDIVAEKYFPIPDDVSTVRVNLLNDDADCDVLARADLSRMTAIA